MKLPIPPLKPASRIRHRRAMQLVYRMRRGNCPSPQAAVSRQIGVLEAYLRIKLVRTVTSARSPSRRMASGCTVTSVELSR